MSLVSMGSSVYFNRNVYMSATVRRRPKHQILQYKRRSRERLPISVPLLVYS